MMSRFKLADSCSKESISLYFKSLVCKLSLDDMCCLKQVPICFVKYAQFFKKAPIYFETFAHIYKTGVHLFQNMCLVVSK